MRLLRALRCAGFLALALAGGAAAQNSAAGGAPVASTVGEAAVAKASRWWSALLTMVTGAPDDAATADAPAGENGDAYVYEDGDAYGDADVWEDEDAYVAARGTADTFDETADIASAGAGADFASTSGVAVDVNGVGADVASAGASAPVGADMGEANVDDASSDALIAWVRSSPGGFFHEAQRVQRPARGPRGIFAVDAIPSGTVVTRVPWDRLVAASDACGTIAKTFDELSRGAESAYAPYMDNIRDYDPSLPCTWPADALALVKDLPPYDWMRHLSWYTSSCGGSVDNALQVRAMTLLVARTCSAGGGIIMAPLYDLLNHRNGKEQNTLVDVTWGASFAVRTSRDVEKGEELLFAYNSGTPSLFRDYGFVEPFPQRWNALPGKHDFELFETGEVQWHSALPDRNTFLVDVQPVFDELARKVDFTPSKQADDALQYRAAMKSALDLAIARTTFADETARTEL